MQSRLPTIATNELSLILNSQTVHGNSYEQIDHVDNTNIDQQQQMKYLKKASAEPPPSYEAALQLTLDPTRIQRSIDEHSVQNPSLNYQNTPFPPGYCWSRLSTNAVCSHYGATGHIRVHTSSTTLTFALAIILFLLSCCLFIIPFCIPSCKKTTHYCSNCNIVLGEVHEFQ